jgi:spermidine synthase
VKRVALLFLVSGAATLMVEITWQRWFRDLFGATAPATSATLVAFFAGQALGSLGGARLVGRFSRPLVLYGALEIAAAAWAACVPPLLGVGEGALASVYDAWRGEPARLLAARFGIALAASLPAALCYGATLPVLAAAVTGRSRELGARAGTLYGANLVGAAAGTVLASMLLPEWLGVPATYAIALGLSLAAALAALALARSVDAASAGAAADPGAAPAQPARKARRARSRPAAVPGATALPQSPLALGALALLSGFGSFALQVLLVHCFAQVTNQSVMAFGTVLATVLGALGIGALAVAAAERSGRVPPGLLLSAALGAAALALAAFPALLVRLTGGLEYLGSERPWPGYLASSLALVVKSAGLPLLATALVFPLAISLAGRARSDHPPARVIGSLVAANTLGAILGALAAPFALLPALGPWLPFAVLAALYAVACLAVPLPDRRWRLRRDLALAVGWIALLARASPLSLPVVSAPEASILSLETTAAGTVAVVERAGERLIQIDNHYALGGTGERVHEERQGHLPLVLAPGARRVAHLGSATAISAGASVAHPVERIVLVELVPGVSRAAERFFRVANRAVHEDPRAEVVLDDARNFLRMTRERFDVIVADLYVPWQAGSAALYAREHFAAARARLAPRGLFCQWLPLYQLSRDEFATIAATFLDVFPEAALFRGDFYGSFPIVALVGWRDGRAAPHEVEAAALRLAAAGERDRWVVDPAGVWALHVGPLASLRGDLAATPRQTDARPILEFASARGHAGGRRGRPDAFVGLPWAQFAAGLRERAHLSSEPWSHPPSEAARRATDGGAVLQLAGALYAEGRTDEASRALARAAELLPGRLLADAEADPTAAELWHEDP